MGVRVKVGPKDSVGLQRGQNFPSGGFNAHGESGAFGVDLALYLRSPYMGQWTWRRIRWKDFSRPSGPSQSRRWTPNL